MSYERRFIEGSSDLLPATPTGIARETAAFLQNLEREGKVKVVGAYVWDVTQQEVHPFLSTHFFVVPTGENALSATLAEGSLEDFAAHMNNVQSQLQQGFTEEAYHAGSVKDSLTYPWRVSEYKGEQELGQGQISYERSAAGMPTHHVSIKLFPNMHIGQEGFTRERMYYATSGVPLPHRVMDTARRLGAWWAQGDRAPRTAGERFTLPQMRAAVGQGLPR